MRVQRLLSFLTSSVGFSQCFYVNPSYPRCSFPKQRRADHGYFMLPKPLGRKRGGMEVGIQTAQLLLDSRRRDQLKTNMKQQYPMLPDEVLDSSIDITAQAFAEVAPKKLKIALKPGGFDRVRPEIEGVIVNFALQQSIIKNIPVLDSSQKRQLVQSLVAMAFDYVLEDAQEVLMAPEVRLEALEEQIKEVKAMMGPWRLFWYRVRHNTREITTTMGLSLAAFSLYQLRNLPVIVQVLSTLNALSGKIVNVFSLAAAKIVDTVAAAAGCSWALVYALWKKSKLLFC